MYYIYCITNNINGKTYIGQRLCPKNKSLETDKYMGSGVYLRNAKKKYGVENFSKKIIAICETQENADILERVFIALCRLEGKAEYNIAKGGNGGYICQYMTYEQKKQYSKKLSESLKGHIVSNETRMKISKSNKGISKNKSAVRSNETKLKISKSKSGKKLNLSDEELKRRSHWFRFNNPNKNKDLSGSNNPHFGIKVPDEQKKRQSEKMKGRHWFNNGIITISAFVCPEGFVAGRLNGGRK